MAEVDSSLGSHVIVEGSVLSPDERSQIAARLRLTPAERLRYLMDMLTFERLARHARRVG